MTKADTYFKNKRAFITGAGSGIGQATAVKLASLGCQVLLSDISQAGLDDTKQKCAPYTDKFTTQTKDYILDVTDYDAVCDRANQINAEFGHVDILINNAGIALAGRFLDCTVEDWQKVMSINLMGVVHGCKAFVPAMAEAATKAVPMHVVNIASMAGYYAAPDVSVYSASKFAVFGLSESLRAEMMSENVIVSAICPGVIHTNIIKNAPFVGSEADRAEVNKLYERRNAGPDVVADAVVAAILGGKAVQPVTAEAWALYGLKRATPKLLGKASAFTAKRKQMRRPK